MSKGSIPKLLHCPFCGGKAQLETTCGIGYVDKEGVDRYTLALFFIQCTKCACKTYPHENWVDAIKAWNRRAGDSDDSN